MNLQNQLFYCYIDKSIRLSGLGLDAYPVLRLTGIDEYTGKCLLLYS